MRTNPSNAYRNGTMYSSYTVEQLARTYELADRHGVNLIGAVTWAFEFEGQPYFDGFRDLATNGINKPVFNVFAMLGRMRGERVAVTSSGALALDSVLAGSVRGQPDVGALATRAATSVSVLVWNYHDDDLPAPPMHIELSITGLKNGRVAVRHSRVDREHSNSYEAWKAMGSPQTPTPAQYADLERSAKLQDLAPATRMDVKNGALVVPFSLPRQGMSLVQIAFARER